MATEQTFEKYCVSPKAGTLWQNFSRVSFYFDFIFISHIFNSAAQLGIFNSAAELGIFNSAAEISRMSVLAQGWRNRTIGHEPLIRSKMCFTKTELVQY